MDIRPAPRTLQWMENLTTSQTENLLLNLSLSDQQMKRHIWGISFQVSTVQIRHFGLRAAGCRSARDPERGRERCGKKCGFTYPPTLLRAELGPHKFIDEVLTPRTSEYDVIWK